MHESGLGVDGIALTSDGFPSTVLRWFDLDAWREADPVQIREGADEIRAALPLVVGLAEEEIPDRLSPLVEALSFTLTGPVCDPHQRALVPVSNVDDAKALITAATERAPRASLALGQLLRQTEQVDLVPGLAAESAVYSMLLGGPEFASWLERRAPRTPTPAPARPLVELSRQGDTLTLELDQPERRNAFSFRMREELLEGLELAVLDDSITRVVMSGKGPVFCSGGDLAEFGLAHDYVAAYLVRLDRAPWRLIDRLRDRFSVRLHGAAVGAGIEMAAFAGHVTATPETFFLLPELEMGLVPGAGGTVSITKRIGRWRTAWMVLSGQRVDTATALAWGLVDEIVES